MTQHPSGVVGWDPVGSSTISRSAVDDIAADLSRQAEVAKRNAGQLDSPDAEYWRGYYAAVTGAHGAITALLAESSAGATRNGDGR